MTQHIENERRQVRRDAARKEREEAMQAEKEQRQKFLLVQQGNLIKWITEFDP